MRMSIKKFFDTQKLDKHFDEIKYLRDHPEAADYYQPYCSAKGIDEKHRLYMHYKLFDPGWANTDITPEVTLNNHVNKDVTIVAGCKVRKEILSITIHSWVKPKQVKEIIIVDWSSDDNIKDFEMIDPRIKIIRVDGEKYYNASKPVNIAIKNANSDIIVKLDVDYIINPYEDFNTLIDITEDEFICGNFSQGNIDNKVGFVTGTNGFLCVHKKHLFNVGLYNESIEDYGREDCEMYDKLEAAGLVRRNIGFNANYFPIYHNPHSDHVRVKNFKNKNISRSGDYNRIKHGTQNIELIINIHRDKNELRRAEIIECLLHNISLKEIKKIHIFTESGLNHVELNEVIYFNKCSHKISIINCESRPSFKELFTYADQNIRNIVIIANNDIKFGSDIGLLNGIIGNQMVCLSRYESDNVLVRTKQNSKKVNIFSFDSWVFKSTSQLLKDLIAKLPNELYIGHIHCDPTLNYVANGCGYNLFNLSRHIKTRHTHLTTTSTAIKATPKDFLNEQVRLQQLLNEKNIILGLPMSSMEDFYHNQPAQMIKWDQFMGDDNYGL